MNHFFWRWWLTVNHDGTRMKRAALGTSVDALSVDAAADRARSHALKLFQWVTVRHGLTQ